MEQNRQFNEGFYNYVNWKCALNYLLELLSILDFFSFFFLDNFLSVIVI